MCHSRSFTDSKLSCVQTCELTLSLSLSFLEMQREIEQAGQSGERSVAKHKTRGHRSLG